MMNSLPDFSMQSYDITMTSAVTKICNKLTTKLMMSLL